MMLSTELWNRELRKTVQASIRLLDRRDLEQVHTLQDRCLRHEQKLQGRSLCHEQKLQGRSLCHVQELSFVPLDDEEWASLLPPARAEQLDERMSVYLKRSWQEQSFAGRDGEWKARPFATRDRVWNEWPLAYNTGESDDWTGSGLPKRSSVDQGAGFVIGVFVGAHLIAYRAVVFPQPRLRSESASAADTEVEADTGLTPEQYARTIRLEATLIESAYRGNGLQQRLTRLALAMVKKPVQYMLSTVSPRNLHSLRNVLAIGLQVIDVKRKYGGHLRFICYCDMQEKKRPVDVTETWEEIEDGTRLMERFRDGYRGIGIDLREGKAMLQLVQFKE